MSLQQAKQALRRSAIVLEAGGFRPSGALLESCVGTVKVCAPGETWPTSRGKPMHALCQVDLTTLPFRPPRLDDIHFITVFIGPDELPIDTPNGEDWCLRAYRDTSALVPLAKPDVRSPIITFPLRPVVVDEDYPCHDDVVSELPPEIADDYYDHFETVGGFKLGGWPSLIQSEIFWAPYNRHPAAPEYVFQIDSMEKAGWMWGDAGVGYFGRGTAPGMRDEWTLSWQCY